MTAYKPDPADLSAPHFVRVALLQEGKSDDGKYLLHPRLGFYDEYFLAVVYKGRPTHHLIAKDRGTNNFTVNKHSYGQCASLEEVRPIIYQLNLSCFFFFARVRN